MSWTEHNRKPLHSYYLHLRDETRIPKIKDIWIKTPWLILGRPLHFGYDRPWCSIQGQPHSEILAALDGHQYQGIPPPSPPKYSCTPNCKVKSINPFWKSVYFLKRYVLKKRVLYLILHVYGYVYAFKHKWILHLTISCLWYKQKLFLILNCE